MSQEAGPALVQESAVVPIDEVVVEVQSSGAQKIDIEEENGDDENKIEIEIENDDKVDKEEAVKEETNEIELKKPEVPLWAISNLPKKRLPVFNVERKFEHMDALEIVFQQSVLAVLKSLDIPSNRLAIDGISELALEYLHGLVHNLHKLVEVQRRRKPALRDVKLLIRQNNLKMLDLYDECTRSNEILSKDKSMKSLITQISKTTNLILELKSNPNFEIEDNDPSAPLFYNQTFEILDLIPSTTSLRFPKMFPQLPPDYTYKKTGSYNKLLDDPRILREKLVEESRYGEKALHNLLNGYNKKIENEHDDDDGDDDDDQTLVGAGEEIEEPMVEEEEEEEARALLVENSGLLEQLPKSDAALNNATNPKNFDIEAFAKRRMEILNLRRAKIEQEIKLKTENPIHKISYELGSYTEKPPLKLKDESISSLINRYLKDEYDLTLKSVKVNTKKRLLKMREERKKRLKLLLQQELERQQRGIEQTFEFGNGDDDEEIEDFDFEFEDDNQPTNGAEQEELKVESIEPTPVVSSNITSKDITPASNGVASVTLEETNTAEELSNGTEPIRNPVKLESTEPAITMETELPNDVGESDSMVQQEVPLLLPQDTKDDSVSVIGTSLPKDNAADEEDDWGDDMFEDV